jgi:hypothetical protein
LAGITTSKKKNDRNRDALIQDVSLPFLWGRYANRDIELMNTSRRGLLLEAVCYAQHSTYSQLR